MSQEELSFDVVIVGAGPAGLSCAIQLAKLSQHREQPLSICIIEKAAQIGGHNISGAVLEPTALNELLPNWQQDHAFTATPVSQDSLYWLTEKTQRTLPLLKALHNQGNYIISLSELCRYLGTQAEQLGVQIFPGFAGSELLFNDENKVIGVLTGEMGLDKNGSRTPRYQAGVALMARHTILAEGCRGSLSQQLIQKYSLAKQPQTYALGIKEIWRIDKSQHKPGQIMHTLGWPLRSDTYGGGFVYHFDDDKISIGLVVGLDYPNPYLDPFQELQRLKIHPLIRPLLKNGQCIGYGARAINEGGWQALPHVTVPGALLIGCAAGTLNVAKSKGIHTAMKSGMLAAEALLAQFESAEITEYNQLLRQSSVGQELYQARNIRPSFRYGRIAGILLAGIDQFIFHGRAPWTFTYRQADHLTLKPSKAYQPIFYPAPDRVVTFDKLSQLQYCHISSTENQPCHLKLKQPTAAIDINFNQYAAPETRYCPAGVYEIVQQNSAPSLQINAQNCIHCKTCDIKDPTQNIRWIPPEGGSGPNYQEM